MTKVLVTGGAGYIGSHTTVALIKAGYDVVILDNLSNSSIEAVSHLEKLCGCSIPFYKADTRIKEEIENIITKHPDICAVMHFAGRKSVSESVIHPEIYYDHNVNGSIVLLSVLASHNIDKIVFSSSATVYGDVTRLPNNSDLIPIPETCPLAPLSPYGQSKAIVENVLRYACSVRPHMRAGILRYFNPIGAHPSGEIGEDPLGTPNNLLPLLARVATKRLPVLQVYGSDYDSRDGTPIRDYVHVMDLADGHVAALKKLQAEDNDENPQGFWREWNLGTGHGTTVYEAVDMFEKVTKQKITYHVVDRRPGDVLDLTADVRRAKAELNWVAKRSIKDACVDLWNWTTKYPRGYLKE